MGLRQRQRHTIRQKQIQRVKRINAIYANICSAGNNIPSVTEIWDVDLHLHLLAKVHAANLHKSQKQDHQLEKNT